MASDDMLSWLKATIEGDKAAAEANGVEVWTAHDEGDSDNWTIIIDDGPYKMADSCGCCCMGTLDEVEAEHVARHDPKDTIARCTAELALLDLHKIVSVTGWGYREWAPKAKPYGCELCHENNGLIMGAGFCDTLTLLASGYQHRPGFNPEWVSG